ncbi:MAG: type I-MYXAN CRISPR-associated protein Cas5/Cmx5/DevS [Desulfobacterales bacterium]|nr:type I-MYXAN CRISPR-associated protein Cas5/Cmx5/DevS [Desulfobacterales bacterium]
MQKNAGVSLLVTVSVCSFRKGYAREYLETEQIPPPSTIYGFLLSLVGEEDRYKYVGTSIALAILRKPELSVVLRTTWRMKNKTLPAGVGNNRSPDYQEILTGLQIAIWVQSGPLADRVYFASKTPSQVDRYGGLSLGESRDLVNDIVWFPQWPHKEGYWLVHDPDGDMPLPVWVDHVGSKGTAWKQFSLQQQRLELPSAEDPRWLSIVSETC